MIRRMLAAMLLLISGISIASEPALERELERLGEMSGGTMGIGVIHLESGRSAWLNPDDTFPMASTYKVPIAVKLLDLVDRGQLSLDERIDIDHYSPGSGTLSRLLDDPGLSVSILNLLEIMLLISDNTATDRILETVGGGMAVTERIQEMGVDGVRVDRTTTRLIGDYLGADDMPSAAGKSWDEYLEAIGDPSEESLEQSAALFEKDPRDSSTPRGMATLLQKTWRGELLSDASTGLLIDIMERCETGEARLKGRLPEGTVVAHKTGTIDRTTNDVGVITLPGDAGHVIIAAFVKESDLPVPDRERAIAEAARAAHDYFLFTGSR